LEELSFSTKGISQSESDTAMKLLLADKQAHMLQKFGKHWDDRKIQFGEHQMPFYYQLFGSEPEGGRSLFISLHGGGGTTSGVNDEQYRNQQHLYDATMKSLEGVYLSPRAPTNTWDLWHQDHIDEFLNILIQMAVIKENINLNKVYLLGYSAGGDGVYQLAPRMADRLAAASMMAGHPNEASPLGLRNLPFAIHMGAQDNGYNRNGKARQWAHLLDTLQSKESESYVHEVKLHQNCGHWMHLRDAMAIPWMVKYKRNAIPQKVVWKQDNRHHTNFYWLKMPKEQIKTGGEVVVQYNTKLNEINIIENYSDTLHLLINDHMLDLDQPITVKYQNKKIYKGKVKRTILSIHQNITLKGDAELAFTGSLLVRENKMVLD
jgi:predicted esterase